ncbi:isocitrate lyase/phosphoenolpyruvate mutase family protein [Burkholderia sp. THE68]|uniref:isocitrate lyase/phosphoenolpyruvate mutase family protein n=1 Tax=Burkholderia sp. THE68 TaxID=758782 RepID=UPI00336AC3C4
MEDGQDAPPLLAAKIEAVRAAAEKAGIALWINARCDVCLQQLVDEPKRAEESIKRAELYGKVGASRSSCQHLPMPTTSKPWSKVRRSRPP